MLEAVRWSKLADSEPDRSEVNRRWFVYSKNRKGWEKGSLRLG